MKKHYLAAIALLILLLGASACGPGAVPESVPTQAPTQAPLVVSPTQPPTLPETAAATVQPALEYQPFRGFMFETSDVCSACHNGMTDEAGNDVSNGTQWQASMMAQAARDPYYLATVSSEVSEHPELRGVIEDKCAPCHMPMAHFATQAAGGESLLLGEMGFLAANNPINALAEDGVSCAACHQILPETLEQEEPNSGHLIFDTETPKGERFIYGQFPVSKDTSRMMAMTSGFTPRRSKHISDSQLCGTCHTLFTPYLQADGTLSETLFPEQTVYLEWENSDFQESASCQNCHMPAAEGKVPPSIVGGEPRSPFSQHRFSGGNAYMLRILQKISETNDIGASADDFEAAITETIALLQNQTADLSVESAQVANSTLGFNVALKTQTGHKFPSGYPSRRTWLHVTVTDAGGAVVFESGAVSPDGQITGNDNDADASVFEPHYLEITSPDQVQIYETILHSDSGAVTTGLLYAASYAKDNRLLPSGFDIDNASADIAVRGQAAEDEDFIGGGDTTAYSIAVDPASGPFTIKVELLYQTIGYRWAQNLIAYNTTRTDVFKGHYNATENLPVVIASQEIVTP